MSKFKRIIVAGPLVIEAVYPTPHPRDGRAARQGKKALSSRAQQLMNLKYAYQKLELEIAANFGVKDLYVTLTYDDTHLPTNRPEAVKKIKAFWKRLRAARRAREQELRYIYVTEHRHGEGRWHHHVLINTTGEDYDEIRRLWGQGGVEFRSIRVDKEKNFETLARYLCKEQRDKLGLRLWSGSRNLRKPERECFRVPDDTPLRMPPKGRVIPLANSSMRTVYGDFYYIKYISRRGLSAGRSKARSRRKRQRAFY